MRIKKIGAVCLSAVLLVSMLLVGNVLPAVADETTVFEANLAINKNGGGQAYIDNNTGGARDYLLERFAFYRNQEATASGASWMVGSVRMISTKRLRPAKPLANISEKPESLRMGPTKLEI